MKKHTYLCLIAILFFSTCKKDPKILSSTAPGYVYEDIAAYSYFKTGTYWIYKDSTSGVEDSVYVYSDTSYLYHRTGTVQEDGDYMYYECHANSAYDTYNYYYKIDMGFYILSTGEVGTVRVRTKPGDYVGQTYLMSNRFIADDVITWWLGDGATYYKAYYDSINLSGITYHAAAKFYDTSNSAEYSSPTFFYIAKNVGIIRKEKLDSNKVWNLIRYNIIQ